MKALLLLAAIALVGCENMPQRAYNPNYQPYLLPTGAELAAQQQMNPMAQQIQQRQMQLQQQQQQQRRPLSCTTRYVGNTAYTDCY